MGAKGVPDFGANTSWVHSCTRIRKFEITPQVAMVYTPRSVKKSLFLCLGQEFLMDSEVFLGQGEFLRGGWVGRSDGRSDGRSVGRTVGRSVGRSDGRTVGRSVGWSVGRSDGRVDGWVPIIAQDVTLGQEIP